MRMEINLQSPDSDERGPTIEICPKRTKTWACLPFAVEDQLIIYS